MRSSFPSTRSLLAVVILPLAIVTPGCSRSGSGLRSYEQALPQIDELREQAGGLLLDVAHRMGSAGSVDVSGGDVAELRRLGGLSRQLARSMKPLDGVRAIERFRTLDAEFARRLTAPPDPTASIVIAPTGPLAFTREQIKQSPSSPPPGKRGPVYDAFATAFDRLAYLALLVDPTAREAFAPRRSPSDLPPNMPIERDGHRDPLLSGITTVEQWRRLIFDDQGRLLLPDNPVGRRALQGWAKHVNEGLYNAAEGIHREIQYGADHA